LAYDSGQRAHDGREGQARSTGLRRPKPRSLFLEIPRAQAVRPDAGLPFKILDETAETVGVLVSISTMHLAKGLEFRAVAVMACDDGVIPL